jgi:hypothetical protein
MWEPLSARRLVLYTSFRHSSNTSVEEKLGGHPKLVFPCGIVVADCPCIADDGTSPMTGHHHVYTSKFNHRHYHYSYMGHMYAHTGLSR